ncbi:hypothetical protein AJ80_06350 [Polytolypa hystricis UAMH7299]|uniref:Uncharacterized protein n=1 Tax=Polytolypa hystricis (strain UAMH7299) TaxID=1447883 RepID=A0A2B7XVY8_POLH7|nr:hypothetical protein AJ80_06350 [Polytolypa hystricis UAMH7299]
MEDNWTPEFVYSNSAKPAPEEVTVEDVEMTEAEPLECAVSTKPFGVEPENPEIQPPVCPGSPMRLCSLTPVPPPVGRTSQQEAEGINYLLNLAKAHPHLWEILVGLYFQDGRHPNAHLGWDREAQEVLLGDWEQDLVQQDLRAKCPDLYPPGYRMPLGPEGEFLQSIAMQILDGNEDLFLKAIKRWQLDLMAHDRHALENILIRAGWCHHASCRPEWYVIAGLKNLDDLPMKENMLAVAHQELPRFTERCMADPNCSESRNPRRAPEETGPFGKRRNARFNSTRSGTRTGTPAKRENPNVAEFGRLFAQQQEDEQVQPKLLPPSTSASSADSSRKPVEKVATECIFYGYRNKATEWKVIDKYERISQGMICEDYPRIDPDISPKYPQLLSGGDVVIRANLSADANKKSKRYAGGFHWIKVTFDSAAAADRACDYSPQEIDGYMVYCEIYQGQGPQQDAPILKGSVEASRLAPKAHTLTVPQSASFLQATDADRSTLPRSFTAPHHHYGSETTEDVSVVSQPSTTSTASSATATAPEQPESTLRQRQPQTPPESEFMTHIPSVRRAALRPVSEALPPQPTIVERVIRSIPILSWFTGDIVGDGPVLREDSTFDYDKSNLYWRFWFTIDMIMGTDLCGLKEDS